MSYQFLEQRFLVWASMRTDIRAAAVIGSYGRISQYRADESSDLDLLFITTEAEQYKQTAWLAEIGPLVSSVFDPTDHVAFAGALDFFTVYTEGRIVDFSVLPDDYVQRLIHDPAAREQDFVHLITPTFSRGFRPLFDPEGLIDQLAAVFPANDSAVVAPSATAFAEAQENFWQGVVRVARKLRPHHLYFAMRWQTGLITDCMRVAEWHARFVWHLPPSTWYRDKYLDQWADPRVVAALSTLYPHYDIADMRRALFALLDLFRILTRELAEALGYPYLSATDEAITRWVSKYLSAE